MKAFIFSIILFSLIILMIVGNSLYLHNICDEMREIISSEVLYSEEKAEKICEEWENHKTFFSFSVHEENIDRMDDLTQNLKSAIVQSNRAEIDKQIFLIHELLTEISKTEEISLQGII